VPDNHFRPVCLKKTKIFFQKGTEFRKKIKGFRIPGFVRIDLIFKKQYLPASHS